MAEHFAYQTGTINVASNASVVTGTGTAWGGRDRAGSLVIARPVGAAPFLIGIVAEVEPRGNYDDLSLPLVSPYNGATLTNVAYVIVDGPAIANGATQAAIYARFTAFLEQNMGTTGNDADDLDMSLVPNNSLIVDHVTRRLKQWRNGTFEFLPSGSVDDRSTVIGDPTKFFGSPYFDNPATGSVHRMNRLFVGVATLGGDGRPVAPQTWLDDYLEDTQGACQFISIDALGGLAVFGASRTSDYRSWTGSATGGAQGITGFAINDDTGAGNPIAAGVVGVGYHGADCTGITLNQFDICNSGDVVDATPHGGVVAGSQYSLGLTPGAFPAGVHNVTAALYIGAGTSTKFRKGIVSFADALDASVGNGGAGVFADLYAGQSVRWLDSGDAVLAEMYGGAGGTYFLNDVHGANFAAGTIGSASALFHGVRSTNGPERAIIQNGNTGSSASAGFDAAADVSALAIRQNSSAAGDFAVIDSNSSAGIRLSARNAAGYVAIRANSPTIEVARFTAAGRMGLGTSAPTALLTVSANVTAPQAPLTGTNIHFTGADGSSLVMCSDSFAGSFSFSSRRANGTAASKAAVASGNFLMQFNAYGYDGTNYGVGAAMRVQAAEAFTSTAQGAFMSIYTTAIGSIVNAESARFDKPTTATYTGLSIWDNDNAALERVTVGAADSGGAGFKLLRIAN